MVMLDVGDDETAEDRILPLVCVALADPTPAFWKRWLWEKERLKWV